MSKKTIIVKRVGDVPLPERIAVGDWIDLCNSEDVSINTFECKPIPLGVCMKLPEGYEAHLLPRGSTYKNFGIIQANSMGIIDESYCGDNGQWFMPAIALRGTFIPKGSRICQFRIMPKMEKVKFVETFQMLDKDRGGYGSTGV